MINRNTRDGLLGLAHTRNQVEVIDMFHEMDSNELVSSCAQQMANVCTGREAHILAWLFVDHRVEVDKYVALSLIEACRVDVADNTSVVRLSSCLSKQKDLFRDNPEVVRGLLEVTPKTYRKHVLRRMSECGAFSNLDNAITLLDITDSDDFDAIEEAMEYIPSNFLYRLPSVSEASKEANVKRVKPTSRFKTIGPLGPSYA
jgi:hypothetical protein